MKDYSEFKSFLKTLNKESKQRLLLHSCCAVCSPYVIDLLSKYFDITIYFSNDNISPKEEYYKRLDTLKNFISKYDSNINIIEDNYDNSEFIEAIKGYEHLGEKSKRCYNCYKYRLKQTALKAKELKFDYFTTTLSISPHKVSSWVNEIGYELEKTSNSKYLYSDFKKDEGFKKTNLFVKEHNLYKQDYCGCSYSLEESIKRRNTFANPNKKT